MNKTRFQAVESGKKRARDANQDVYVIACVDDDSDVVTFDLCCESYLDGSEFFAFDMHIVARCCPDGGVEYYS